MSAFPDGFYASRIVRSVTGQSTLFDALQDLCNRGETGRLDIRKGSYAGTVYLQGGIVIDVDSQGCKGQEALLEMLSWADAMVCWFQGTMPYRHTCHITVRELEALWLGVESKPRTKTRCAPTTQTAMRAKALGISLPMLGNYEIVFQAEDPAHRPTQHVLGQPLKPAYLIGAAQECDIRIDHYSVCQMHAAIMIEDDIIRVWDLGSHNATHVNGDLVDEALLQSGDILEVGDIAFKVTLRALGEATVRRAVTGPAQPVPRPSRSAPPPSGALRFEDIRAEQQRAETHGNALFMLFDTLRSGKTPRP